MNKGGVSVSKMVELLDLKVYTDDIDLKKRKIQSADINRPALQLAGYFQHFESSRVQVIGNVEYFYTKQLRDDVKLEIYRELLSYDIPCIIFSRDLVPDNEFVEMAQKNGIPVLGTSRPTSEFTAELIYELGEQLAPCITIHG
ncbi:MAG: HPr(Ser) kinase/phosphatase, partial [Agathobacter sp.]|nr:HPr(Ser) kinase/phosphatase [Agathobacter sp.]